MVEPGNTAPPLLSSSSLPPSPPPTSEPSMVSESEPPSEPSEAVMAPPPSSNATTPAQQSIPSGEAGQSEVAAQDLLSMAEIQDVPNSSPNTDSPPLPPDAATAQEEMAVRTQQERSATGPRTPATAENGSEPVIENKLKVPPLPLHAPVRSTTSSHPFQHLVPSPPPTPSNLAPTDMAPPDVPPRPTDGSTSTVDPESALLQYLPSGNLGPGQDASSSKETRALFSMFLDDSRPDDRIQRADPRGPQSYQTKSAQHAACQANFDYKGNSKCLQWQGPNDGEVLLRTVARAYGVSLRSASNPNGKLIYLTSKDTNEIIDVDTEFAYDNKDLIVHVEPEDGENAFCGVSNDGGPFNVVPCIVRLFTCEYAAPSRRLLSQKRSDDSFVM